LLAEIRRELHRHLGERAAAGIESHLGGLETFLAGDFYPWHVRLHRRRPPYWALRSRGGLHLIAHDAATRETLEPILRDTGITLPPGWERRIDDGIMPALMPLRSLVPDAALRRVLDEIAKDFSAGRFPWLA
jgi:hypothetical protein